MFERIKLASEVLLNADLRKKYDDIEKARRERDANIAQSDKRRQQFVSDLLAREQEYQDALSNLLNKQKQTPKESANEVDELIQATKHAERLEQMREKEARQTKRQHQHQVIYKLDSTFKSKLTTEAVMSDLKQFGKVASVQLHNSGKKALVSFVYNDSAVRAINGSGSLTGFSVRRANEKDLQKFKLQEEQKSTDPIEQLKARFGVTGMAYRNGFGGESIEELEQSIRQYCAKRLQV